ncbi:ABC-three component system middle component 7 [Pseudomonas kribbensis]|uniref:ABC-three component system middle component 7 n=1 Tax=Pseudomonas kribbensis TaxID=1628086 RepID=UPI003BF7C577
MITPNKFIPLKESALGKIELTLSIIDDGKSVGELYETNRSRYDSLEQFIYSIEILYLTNKIEFNELNGIISKC